MAYGRPGEAFTNTLQAASRALELDPTQASPHGSLALAKIHMQWDWSEADQGFRRALKLDPSDGDVRHLSGHFLLWAGQPEESARECRLGLEVDPFNAGNISCLGWHELCTGHDDRALEETRRALALDPNDAFGLMTLGWIYEQKGMYQEALAALRRSEELVDPNRIPGARVCAIRRPRDSGEDSGRHAGRLENQIRVGL